MLENMAGEVAMAMHADRLAQVAKNMRLAEAKQGRRASTNGWFRKAVAMTLMALAAWIAPPATRATVV